MWVKAIAGAVPGFFLSAGLIGLLCWLPPGPWESTLVIGLAAFFPVWIGVICAAFRFPGGAHAWGWLSAMALLSLGLLRLLQANGWVR